MASFTNKFDSAKQDWETPLSLFNPINAEFNFTLDAAASAENTKVLNNYFTEVNNGMIQSWGNNVV